jgi:protein gp37
MGAFSKIEWTHHTFNPWWGCTRVSPACKYCYAESWSRRLGLDIWGGKVDRRFFSEAHWRNPIRWNAAAEKNGTRARVFCASMADIFEDRAELNPWREKLWPLIEATPYLDWLLLTKRPQRISRSVPWAQTWPDNVWVGTTAESQKWAEKRIPHLVELPAKVRFLSCEPLLDQLDLSRWLRPTTGGQRVDWVIAGGESGAKARPMNPEWVRSLRDQCLEARAPFHFKQWGHWGPSTVNGRKGLPTVVFRGNNGQDEILAKLGKSAAGRRLDGRTWDGLPSTA